MTPKPSARQKLTAIESAAAALDLYDQTHGEENMNTRLVIDSARQNARDTPGCEDEESEPFAALTISTIECMLADGEQSAYTVSFFARLGLTA